MNFKISKLVYPLHLFIIANYILKSLSLKNSTINLYLPEFRQDVYVKEEYHYLSVPKVATFTVYDNLDCAFKCLRNPSCLSINLAASKGADGKLWCELLSSEKYSNPKEYKSNKSFHHFFQMVGKILNSMFTSHTRIVIS